MAPPLKFGFIPVNLDLVRSEEPLEFGIYAETPVAGKVMVVEPGKAISDQDKRQLLRSGMKFYAMVEDRDKYRAHLQANLKRLLDDDRVGDHQAAELAYDLSLQVMEAVFEKAEAETIEQATKQINTTTDMILAKDQALFALLELTKNSPDLHVHCCNVSILGVGLAKELINEGQEIDVHALGPALFFHDLGQISTGNAILSKTEPLSPEDWEKIKEHPQIGQEILEEAGFLTPEAKYVLDQHHERLDGSGYPHGLKGDEIHLFARICMIADCYDALTSERAYREMKDPGEAASIMLNDLKGSFDQKLLTKFIMMFRRQAEG